MYPHLQNFVDRVGEGVNVEDMAGWTSRNKDQLTVADKRDIFKRNECN